MPFGMAGPEMSKSYDETYKILVLGDSSVGKTCIITRLCDRAFHESYVSTIGIDCKQKCIELGGKKIRLRIWDTAGQERFRTLTTAYYRGAQGILLAYDITNSASFDHLKYWLRNIDDMAPGNISTVVVGNKCDKDDCRAIETETGSKLAAEFDVPFFETSSKENINIENAFDALAKSIKKKQHRQLSQDDSRERKQSLTQYVKPEKQWCGC